MTTDRSSVRLEHQSYKLKVDGSTPSDRTTPTAQDIRSLRNRLYLTRAQFAELVGCSRSSIVNWELGRSRPREDYAEVLSIMISWYGIDLGSLGALGCHELHSESL